MTDKQPEALRLSDLLERDPSEWGGLTLGWKAAAELRRLHGVNAELVSFVSFVLSGLNTGSIKAKQILDFRNEDANEIPMISLASMARAALTKAEGE